MKLQLRKYFSIEFSLLGIYLVFQLLLLTTLPDAMEDEPWYANTAYNFIQGNGFTNSNVGHYGGDFFIFYTSLLSIGFKILGCSLFTSRFISVIGGLIALWGLLSILRINKISTLIKVAVSSMFIFSNVTYVIFRTGRPEGWILAFAIWALYYLFQYHDKPTNKSLIWMAIFSTLSFLIHPNGALFIINIGLYLFIRAIQIRKVKALLYFVSICLGLVLIFLLIMISMPNFSIASFVEQVGSRNSVSESSFSISENIHNFIRNYILGIKRLYILIFEIGILVSALLFSKRGSLLNYLAWFGIINLILSLLLFSKYSSRHFGEIILFSFLAFMLLFQMMKSRKVKQVLLFFCMLYLLNNIAGDAYLILQKSKNTSYNYITKQIKKNVPAESTVATALEFWYPLKDSKEFYSNYIFWESKPHQSLSDLLSSNALDYVIYTDAFLADETGTSGRKEDIPEKMFEFFTGIKNYAESNGEVIKIIPTIGYGEIRIYRIKK